jgi:hypothetical protein
LLTNKSATVFCGPALLAVFESHVPAFAAIRGAHTTMDDTGEQPQSETRWGAVYGAVAVFTLVSIVALMAFSAWFGT